MLEKVIDVDIILNRTSVGKDILEALKEGTNPDDQCLTMINHNICDFLKWNYGLHPTTFHKNLLALSLVTSYPVLTSSTRDVPQALWFHPHGRGQYKHAGRIHYHMEYLARISNERVIKRPRLTPQQESLQSEALPEVLETNIDQLILELKFLCPGPSTRSRAEELWIATFRDRDIFRKKGEFQEYMKLYPVCSAFDGIMISLDFCKLHPDAFDFCERFAILQTKILARYDSLYLHIQDDFVRTLAIIRIKNPSRGAKRTKQNTVDKKNPLNGIIEWVEMDNPFPVVTANTPILYVKSRSLEGSNEGIIFWKGSAIPIAQGMMHSFRILCESFMAFSCDMNPTDKQFFTFIFAAIMGIGTLSTTGETFIRSLA